LFLGCGGQAMLNLPQSTEVNQPIAKSKFYENADITSSLKAHFVDDIEKIIWANKISPRTLNITEGRTLKEIEVFHIRLKKLPFPPKILEAIDQAIPYYILYVLEYQGRYQLWLGYKEKSTNTAKQAGVVRYFSSEWTAEPKISLIGNGVDSIYQGFLEQLSDHRISTASSTELKDQVAQATQKEKLEKQIEKLTAKMNAEKQFNRKIEIKWQIKQLQQQIEDLNNG
jgi:hypothetical protein